MSEKREPKKADKSLQKRSPDSSDDEQSRNDHLPDIPPSDSSIDQSSDQSGDPSALAGPSTASAAGLSGINATDSASDSKTRFSVKKTVSGFMKRLSPRKYDDQTQSPKKSRLSSAATKLISGACNLVRRSEKSSESNSLVNTDYECTPPPAKEEKAFYAGINTFVTREVNKEESGNQTDTSSLDTSSGVTSPTRQTSTEEETSPTEETPLLRPENPPSKDQPPKKDPKKDKSPKK